MSFFSDITDALGITHNAQTKAMDQYNQQMQQSAGASQAAIERAKQYLQTYYLGGQGLTGGGGSAGGTGLPAGITPEQLAAAIQAATAGGGVSGSGPAGQQLYMTAQGQVITNQSPQYYSLLASGQLSPVSGSGSGGFNQQAFLDALKSSGAGAPAAPPAPAAKWGEPGYVSSGGAMGELSDAYKRALDAINTGRTAAASGLQSDVARAQAYIPDYLNQGRTIAESYYKPYQRAVDVLTGVQQGTPDEVARLTTASPLYNWQLQQGTTAMDRNLRAKGIGSSRFGAKAQGDMAAQLAAQEQDRRIAQLMGMYQQSGSLGNSMGQAYTGAGAKLADMGMDLAKQNAGITTGSYGDMSNLEQTTGAKRAGLLTDLGTSMASAEGALGSAQANAFASAAANTLANQPKNNLLDNALKIYTAGVSGGWWGPGSVVAS